ncbi:hypothetical protein IW261DRAFT_1419749 [Armillaria novae-zelandiae]|uniref:Uncharacterized protein n=1 Tax=Armillaria novae-zelandiae TaxID=153914 RepID=A0AA39UAU9_9AGAR|nr:hypothetical protein IW261DRAFT_1419749 [Armillaria novae-zelandiae]
MVTQTESDKALILHELDADLNSVIFCSLLHGIYTGIVAVVLENMIFADKSRPTGRALTIIIILLYISTTIDFALTWSYVPTVFIDHGETLRTEYISYQTPGMGITIGAASAGAICTVLADSTMVWRCWIVWGKRHYTPPYEYILGYVLYSSFTLASTLWCTLFIIYRIVTVARSAGAAGGGLSAYRHVIEVLVESSALYSISSILFVGFYARNDATMYYFDVLSAITRGIAPTLLIRRVAAGHARPDDSWQGSIVSSLDFGTHPGDQNSQQDSMMTWNEDLEGQRETDGEFDHRTLAYPQDYTTNEGLILRDAIDERPEDHPSAILIVPRD